MSDTPTGLSVRIRQDGPIPLDVAFECGASDVLALFGPSGSGKTTILRSIAGLFRPRAATIRCSGELWTDTESGVHVAPHRRATGFVFQDYALFPHLSTLGNVAAALGHLPARDRRAEAERLLSLVHLDGLGDRRPSALSGGQRQRVALARALARSPRVLLLDEPFAAVDRRLRATLHDELDALRHRLRLPIVLVTHDYDDVVRLASHLVLIEGGHQVATGALDELSSRPDLAWLGDAGGPGSVFDADVVSVNAERGLTELRFPGGRLLAPGHALRPGDRVRVRVPAREVILASDAPPGLSIHNALNGRVESIHALRDDMVVVRVACGDGALLAEVTRDAVARLALAPGTAVVALVKSVSLDVKRRTR